MSSDLLALVLMAVGLVSLLLIVAKLSKPKLNKSHFQARWQKVEAETNLKLAVLAADSLVDEALRFGGIRGGTMGERLNNAEGLLRDLNGAWTAHKLRNRIAHEHYINISDSQAKNALRQFKKALKDIGAL